VWESYKLDQYVQRLAEQVFNFQEKVEDLLVVEEQLDVDVRSLETCPYSATTLADILAKIQHAIDDLSLRQYSNLHVWVNRLDLEVRLPDIISSIFRIRKRTYQFFLVYRLKRIWQLVFKQVSKLGQTLWKERRKILI
jgi:hypothetical protein